MPLKKTKSISFDPDNKGGLLHIELPGCIVNILTGVRDANGQSVVTIEVRCDAYAGEQAWRMPDMGGAQFAYIRVQQDTGTTRYDEQLQPHVEEPHGDL